MYLSDSEIQVKEYTYVNRYYPNNGKNDIQKEYRLQKCWRRYKRNKELITCIMELDALSSW